MSPFPLPICRLSLALVVFTAVGCGHTTPVRPTPKGQLDAQLHVGGPAVMLGGPIPVPLSTVGASYGLSDRFDLQGHLHVTALFYKVAGLDVGSTFLAVKEEGAVPAVALNARLYGFSDLQTAVRPYLELNAAASYLFGQRFLTYLSATGFLQLFGPPLFSFAVGEEFQLGRFGLQVEARWYEPDYSTRFNAIDPLSPGYQGALGLVLGLRYRFGGEG